jgi:hypothetical protein
MGFVTVSEVIDEGGEMLEKERHYLLDSPSLKGNRIKNTDTIVGTLLPQKCN